MYCAVITTSLFLSSRFYLTRIISQDVRRRTKPSFFAPLHRGGRQSWDEEMNAIITSEQEKKRTCRGRVAIGCVATFKPGRTGKLPDRADRSLHS